MADSNKVIMHLEVTDGTQNENSSEYFISGPVKIFAAVDDLSTTFEEDGICGLFSDRFLEVVKDSSLYENREPIIVFVRNLFDLSNPENIPASDSLKYRGSYFLFEYDTESWQEVLIGTHTHENKEILDKFSELDISGAENKLLSIIPDEDGYSFAFVEDNRLPTLPGSVLKAIEHNNNLPNFPNSNEGHHLDGTVVYNSDDPTVIATCNDLYDYLRTKGKHLHITKIADEILLSKESGQILESFQHIIAEEDLHPASVLEFTGTLSFDGFGFLVFVGNNALNPLTYDIKSSGNKIFVKIPRDDATLNDVVTVLALEPGEITVKNLYNVVLEEDITLS
jgi:uncharacterized protein YciU (UPF0263 family)